MGIKLTKGGRINLSKGSPSLKKLLVGLGWNVNEFDTGYDFDLDASAFLVSRSGRCASDSDFVFYGAPEHPSGSVMHSGDDRTGGDGENDDEQIVVDLSLVPENIEKIAFTVTIYEAGKRRQNFGQVSNAYIRVVDMATNNELVRYDLGEDFSVETAIVAAELYKSSGEWKFNAIGSGYQGGLAALCKHYGLDADAEE